MLKDVQNFEDKRGIDIQRVGVKDVEVPLIIQRKNDTDQTVYARATLSASLPANFKGTHMSRFIEILNNKSQNNLVGCDVKGILDDIRVCLEAKNAYLKFEFKYFVNKVAPITKNVSPVAYDCAFEGSMDNGEYNFYLYCAVPVTTLCPCSKEISEYSAHNQRALLKIKISYPENRHIWLEDLIELGESCGSSPVYSLLKRPDEKYVTEKAYENPKFVEDVLRDAIVKLGEIPQIAWYEVECEAYESIHNHSAFSYARSPRRGEV